MDVGARQRMLLAGVGAAVVAPAIVTNIATSTRTTTGFDANLRTAEANVVADHCVGHLDCAVLLQQPVEDPLSNSSRS
jgi:hypothetical protein